MSSRSITNYPAQADGQGQSVTELLSRLATESSQLVRDEIALVRQELREQVVIVRTVLLLSAVAAFIAFAALLALCGAAAAALAPVTGVWQALLIIGGALALIFGIVAFVSMRTMRRMTLKPEQTLETLEENKEWLKELT